MRNQKGITLIALVITIIVLLILAGVSIAMLTGQNGILTRAQDATEETVIGDVEEATKLAIAAIITDNKGFPDSGITDDELDNALLQEMNSAYTYTVTDNTTYLTVKGAADSKEATVYVKVSNGAVSRTVPSGS